MPDDTVPEEVNQKMIAWRKWRSVWNTVHYGLGFTSSALAAVVAANTKQAFLTSNMSVAAAAIAAGLTFLVTALSASAKAAAFETAAREVEKAIALFRAGAEKSTLFQAEARGIDVLNKLK